MAGTLVERYAERIEGVISCFDRAVLTGTLPDIWHAKATTPHRLLRRHLSGKSSGWIGVRT